MSQPPKITAANQLAIYFETNSRIPLADVAEFLAALDELAVEDQAGPLHLVQAGTGTFWLILEQALEQGDKLASIGAFALSLAALLRTGNGRLPKVTAQMTVEHGIRTTAIITCEGSTDVSRDMMPLVRILERQLNAEAASSFVPSEGEFVAAAGDPNFTGIAAPSPYVPPFVSADEVGREGTEFARQAVASDGTTGKLVLKPYDTREKAASVRRLEQTPQGWFALHEPHGGRTVPAFAPPGHTIAFRQARVTVRGHLYRRNGRPIGYIVNAVIDGGSLVKISAAE